MYETFFGLTKKPFSLTPDTGLFVNLPGHERCFALLIHVLESGEGFLKVVGEVGTGKTILCRKLLRFLDADQAEAYHSVYIPNPMLSSVGLYRAVGQELGLLAEQQNDHDALLSHITEKILALAELNKSVVIVIDEAQSLPAATLEALRLITNLETEEKKLVQVILFGQTELDTLLNEDRFRQLRQRITFAHYLQPLSALETGQYIAFRLGQCGYNGPALFSSKAVDLLFRTAHGTPRMINVIAHKSLMAAFADQSQEVLPVHIQRAVADGQYGQDTAERAPSLKLASWLTLVATLLFAAAVYWRLV
ncbi:MULTISPECIES: AAA family ATPase [Reinekea]|jgi:MSHA biogenesis protein MshM|uniref:MSHA biogenesis protein MshM n=1 Tax=Reinekea forsetii TaxID=1336806 RepID=A0A2K8KT94_9GAMM|nr:MULTISPECIES: AAA family ATPase [Reinekea]ATX77955.1 MSHA biogenesis protein MshM [Reinekea forsetii]MDO7643233.1 AAA family ATPase [Reinekea forsetii]